MNFQHCNNFDENISSIDCNNDCLNDSITAEEVLKVVKDLKLKKSAGCDGITNEMIRVSCDPEHLQQIIDEQGHLLDKDGVNILTRQENTEEEDILLIEPRPKSASTSVGKKVADQEVPSTSTSKAAEEENEKYIWDDSSIKRLIEYRKEHSYKFEEGRITKKAVWEIIAIKFNATSNKEAQTVTWMQLKSKWQKLETKFKNVED
ncbi:unnamed protein product [Mytilus coruscus]|uniref:Myb/SANT-like DNA-binding domain-containing protein n=1 Tax=Mytilus coruscus TaxID=42192 RepID=A0A6J8B5I4_MYTCO|nr:unnamed protein product [Mytilus coruscus]